MVDRSTFMVDTKLDGHPALLYLVWWLFSKSLEDIEGKTIAQMRGSPIFQQA